VDWSGPLSTASPGLAIRGSGITISASIRSRRSARSTPPPPPARPKSSGAVPPRYNRTYRYSLLRPPRSAGSATRSARGEIRSSKR